MRPLVHMWLVLVLVAGAAGVVPGCTGDEDADTKESSGSKAGNADRAERERERERDRRERRESRRGRGRRGRGDPIGPLGPGMPGFEEGLDGDGGPAPTPWAQAKAGTRVTYTWGGGETTTLQVTAVDGDEAQCEMVYRDADGQERSRRQGTLPRVLPRETLEEKFDLLGREGREKELSVGEKRLQCRVYERRERLDRRTRRVERWYYCSDVPGGIVRKDAEIDGEPRMIFEVTSFEP